MELHFEYSWTTYGHSMQVFVNVMAFSIFSDVWVDSWKKASPSQQNAPRCVACSVGFYDPLDPWFGWAEVSETMEVELNLEKE